MSQTTTPVATVDQPSHAISNVMAHPGSTWAAAGIVAMTVATMVQANSLPTTPAAWIAFFASLATAVMAALGK